MSREWPPYRTVRELVHVHHGRPAVVLGGGASSHATLDAVPDPDSTIYISANDHGAKALRARGIASERLAYTVCLDKIEQRCRRELWDDGRQGAEWGVPVISKNMWADFRILDAPAPFTGQVAAWLARLMGCDPIILGGMDCYSGPTYWHAPKAKSSGKTAPVKFHVQLWRKLAQTHPANYQAIAGELARVFPPIGAALLHDPPSRGRVARELVGTVVEFQETHELTGRVFPIGTRIEVREGEAQRLVRSKKARVRDAA
jgi:hypothetical protein